MPLIWMPKRRGRHATVTDPAAHQDGIEVSYHCTGHHFAGAAPHPNESRPLPMSDDWTTPLPRRRHEQDPAKLTELCEQARRTINDQMLALGTQGADTPERRELEEALRRLLAYESKPLPPPPIKNGGPA
jgi:hypothetical protein